jgi:ubiquinone biosynthesis protein COQ4
MFERIKTILEMLRIIRAGKNVGDAAALKLTLLGRSEEPSPYSEAVLAQRERNFSPLDIEQLASYAKDTFGYAYSEFMARNNLHPFNFTDRVLELFTRYPVSMRYVRLHDMIHVLLEFETDIKGELGVYAFVGEQNYNKTMNKAARAARLMGRLMFWSRTAIRAAQAKGVALSKDAKVLISEPLEDMLALPLEDVRRDMGLGQASRPDL